MADGQTATIASLSEAHAEIDWARTQDVCSDVYCTCGEHFHHCTHGDKGSGQHTRCPHCQTVIRLESHVNLLVDEPDFGRDSEQEAFVQWKGTTVFMTGHCACGNSFPIEGDFTYKAQCPACSTTYHCNPMVKFTPLTEAEASEVSLIHEPERDFEFQD